MLAALAPAVSRVLAEATNPALQKPSNPILPDTSELIIATITFLALFIVMRQFAFPMVRKTMAARADKIRESLESAEKAKTDAEATLAEYQAQLADAKSEANRIIEEARASADALRRDIVGKAEAEAGEARANAARDIEAAKARALEELHAQISSLTIDLAEKVVKRNLDREANTALIEDYISSIGRK